MAWNVLIAHAPAEEVLADTFAKPIEQAGYTISYRGGVSVGESIELDAALALESGGPVVVCGTQLAVGSRWVGQLVNAARAKAGRPRVFVVQMEREAYVELLARDGVIAPYWEDPANAIRGLIRTLLKYYPLETVLGVQFGKQPPAPFQSPPPAADHVRRSREFGSSQTAFSG